MSSRIEAAARRVMEECSPENGYYFTIPQSAFDELRAAIVSATDSLDDVAYRDAACEEWHRDGEIEIDADAIVSASDEGAYVASWVWVSAPDCENEDV